MQDFFHNIKKYWTTKKYLLDVATAVGLLVASLIVNYYAGIYATRNASNAVTDIILNHIRVYDVDVVFIYGPVFLYMFLTFLALKRPEQMPFLLKSLALFTFVRSGFINLTHIGPFPDHLHIASVFSALNYFTFGGDLFFSGHTGFPFLFALIFWEHKPLRYFFIAASLFFGIVALMGHLHYTIDVVAAFFITYTIYHLCCKFFARDKRYFDGVKSFGV